MCHIEHKRRMEKTYIFREDFVNATSLFIDETGDMLHTTSMSKMMNSRPGSILRDWIKSQSWVKFFTLDVIAQDLAVTDHFSVYTTLIAVTVFCFACSVYVTESQMTWRNNVLHFVMFIPICSLALMCLTCFLVIYITNYLCDVIISFLWCNITSFLCLPIVLLSLNNDTILMPYAVILTIL